MLRRWRSRSRPVSRNRCAAWRSHESLRRRRASVPAPRRRRRGLAGSSPSGKYSAGTPTTQLSRASASASCSRGDGQARARGVAGVVSGDTFEHPRGVSDVSGEDANLIERRCEGHEPIAADPPVLGFRPTTPQNAAGCRTEPPVSEPSAIGTRPAATAAAEPPEEPPGTRPLSMRIARAAERRVLGGRAHRELIEFVFPPQPRRPPASAPRRSPHTGSHTLPEYVTRT
jgi:hypothetical protein